MKAKEIFIAGLKEGSHYKPSAFELLPELAEELWERFDEDTIEQVPAPELSPEIFSEETKAKFKRGDKFIPLEMNDKGEL